MIVCKLEDLAELEHMLLSWPYIGEEEGALRRRAGSETLETLAGRAGPGRDGCGEAPKVVRRFGTREKAPPQAPALLPSPLSLSMDWICFFSLKPWIFSYASSSTRHPCSSLGV